MAAYAIVLGPLFRGDSEMDQPFHSFFMEHLDNLILDGYERVFAYIIMLPSSQIYEVIFDQNVMR